ncbi:hypothetical protein LTR28_013275 [Elasticomyces elasticus]|nr:hypothetical protein LTR28_013275 [Elasticomyces elasticus]
MSTQAARFLLPVSLANLFAIGGSTYYLHTWHAHNLEEHEARMDELEGTLRGHIGLIEESLDRLEGKQKKGDEGKKTIDSVAPLADLPLVAYPPFQAQHPTAKDARIQQLRAFHLLGFIEIDAQASKLLN